MRNINTPVLFLIFNRPESTKKVFEQIRKAGPPKLYVAADGPRKDRADEAAKCEAVRKIATDVDWDCEVKTLFRDENLGCKYAVSGGIDWFFNNEEMGIILEDDCLPSQSFFPFCQELLKRYSDDERIMLITGYNRQNTWISESEDYFFSNFGGIWGWASWRRAWNKYDIEMSRLDEFAERGLFESLLGKKLGEMRKKELFKAPDSTWDYQWAFTRHLNSGLSCVPTKNLIENIGFGEDATHTTLIDTNTPQETFSINFPLRHNEFIVADRKYDLKFIQEDPIILRAYKRIINNISKLFNR